MTSFIVIVNKYGINKVVVGDGNSKFKPYLKFYECRYSLKEYY